MANRTLNVGVIGCGRIGRIHAENLATRIPGARVAALADVAGAAAKEVAAQLHVAKATADHRELLADPAVDAVAICSSTDTHSRIIQEAAAAGKHIFCEKPIDYDLTRIRAALAAVDKARVKLQIGFNRRFDPSFAKVRELVASGAVGQPHVIRITSRDPGPPPLDYIKVSGGIFLDMTIHDFDMARYVTGSEVVEVVARGAVRIDPRFGEAGDVDTAVVTLVHEDGALTLIDNSRRAVYGYDQRVEAFGSAGMAASENPPAHTGIVRTVGGTAGPGLPHFFLERYTPSYLREWEAFLAAARDGGPPPVPGSAGRAALVVALAAGRSLHEGRVVRVDEIG